MRVQGGKNLYTFYYSTDGKNFIEAGKADTCYLSAETAGGFTGIMLGLYAVGPAQNGQAYAEIEHVDYKPL